VPGGNAVDSTEIYQEGLQIPILKLYDRGQPNETLLAILTKNVRIPDVVLGDLGSQLAACTTGEAGYLRLIERYGVIGLESLIDQLLDYTESMVRAELAKVRDGTYNFEDHIDDDGFGSGPIMIRVALTFSKGTLTADFTGTSRQAKSALNATVSFTKSAVYTALMCVMNPDILSNDGFYRPIRVLVPRGTILNPNHPAPRAARGLTGFRTVDTVAGALHQAMPTAVAAAGEGGATMIAMGGHSESGAPFIFIDFMCSGWGARPTKDAVDGTSSIAANLSNVPVEEVELHQPVKVEEYGFVPDTGGPGKFRGSLSVVRQLRFLEQEGILQIRSDRRRFPPYGLGGGRDGTSSWNILNPGTEQEILATNITCPIVKGDVLRHVMAGGGGFGNPMERDPELVLKDVLEEKISTEYALREYGVVIDEKESRLDWERTHSAREAMSSLVNRSG
jgi:N-methylhydantoinase B